MQELRANLRKASGGLAHGVYGPSAFAAAREIADRAKASTAFRDRTGNLRRSIRVEPTMARRRVRGRLVTVRDGNAEVRVDFPGLFVEFGHGGPRPAPPHPFLRPAMRAARQAALQAATREARRRFNIAVRRGR